MAKGPSERQDALRLVARALDALRADGALCEDDVRALLPAWRALAPVVHPGAGADTLDVATLARIAAWSPTLLSARTFVVCPAPFRAPPRVEPREDGAVALVGVSAADALAVALTLSLEAAKRAHGLGAPADALRAAFHSPDEARAAVSALEGAGARTLELRASIGADDDNTHDDDNTGAAVARAVGDRPTYVFAGAGARALHDLLSPMARRLGARLALLGRGGRAPADDDAYRGLYRLEQEEPASIAERLAAEEPDGLLLCGRALVIQAERLADSAVDRRAREPLSALKKARAALVCVDDERALSAALSSVPGLVRVVAVLTEATAPVTPQLLMDAGTDVVTQIDNALASAADGRPAELLVSAPSLGLVVSDTAPTDAQAFSLAQVALHARARAAHGLPSALAPDARLAVRAVQAQDKEALFAAVLDVLARIGQVRAPHKPPSPRGRP